MEAFKIENMGSVSNCIITERRKAEVALRENEEKYRILIQTLPYIVYEVDAGGRFIFVSDGVKQLGYAHLNQGVSKAREKNCG